MAHWVMARPIAVLVPTLAFLLVLGTPFLRLEQGIPDATVLPPGIESREAAVALSTEFRAGETSPIIVLADRRGLPRPTRPTSRILDARRRRSTPSTGSTASRARSPGCGPGRPAPISTPPASPRCSPRRGPAAAGARRGLDRLEGRTSVARPSGSMRSARSPLSPAGTAVVPHVRAVDGRGCRRRRSVASRPTATTSWPASRRRSHGRSA